MRLIRARLGNDVFLARVEGDEAVVLTHESSHPAGTCYARHWPSVWTWRATVPACRSAMWRCLRRWPRPSGPAPQRVLGHVPGDWEGYLILGQKCSSAIATLVERQARYTILTWVRHALETWACPGEWSGSPPPSTPSPASAARPA